MAVYLIQAGNLPIVKIGKAADPASRLIIFQTGHYETLRLLKTWPGSYAEESAMHQAFSEYRIRRDWFRFCDAMLTVNPAELVKAGEQNSVSKSNEGTLNVIKRHPVPLDRAVQAAGGYVPFCTALGIARRTVFTWIAGREIPFRQLEKIERLWGIPREELLPHVYRRNGPSPRSDDDNQARAA